jgi:hypothetical protein
VRSEVSRPGISSARKTTAIPGRAQVSGGLALSRRRSRLDPLLVFIATAPIAPNAPAAKAKPPNTSLVLFLIGYFKARISNQSSPSLTSLRSETELSQMQGLFPGNN